MLYGVAVLTHQASSVDNRAIELNSVQYGVDWRGASAAKSMIFVIAIIGGRFPAWAEPLLGNRTKFPM